MVNAKDFLLQLFPRVVADLLLGFTFEGYAPKTTDIARNQYDYIIVGGGSAGSVLAARLSELSCVTVLLLEAGGKPPALSEVPLASRFLWNTEYDWQFRSEPQKHCGYLLKNRSIPLAQGKALGGGSMLNAKLYVRGNRRDYDDWERNEGCTGWGYDKIFKYFLKLEDNQNPDVVRANPRYHNVGGPLTAIRPKYEAEIKRPIIRTLLNFGFENLDANAGKQTGVYDQQGTLRDGRRCSTAKAYLVPAQDRENLDIVVDAYVTKVEIADKTAVGVWFEKDNEIHYVSARKEIILSAGAIKSPQILMLSGIGLEETLNKFNIRPIQHLPVGLNFHDHPTVQMNFELSRRIPSLMSKLIQPDNLIGWRFSGTGPYGSTEAISLILFASGPDADPEEDFPTYETFFVEGANYGARQFGLTDEAFNEIYGYYEDKPYYWCSTYVLRPESRGSVTLKSANPRDPPALDPNFFAKDSDVEDILQGMKNCLRVSRSRIVRQKLGSRVFRTKIPGCDGNYTRYSDDYLRCFARSIPVTYSHPCGTCRMGSPDKNTTVVDPQLKVLGIKNLRVVDASIMPIVISGNLNVPVIMIAENAADMIKEDLGQCPVQQQTSNQPRWFDGLNLGSLFS